MKTEKKSRHTQGKWKIQESEKYISVVGDNDFYILDVIKDSENIHKANAQRIVQAVNMYDEFVSFLRSISVYDDRFLSQDEYDTRQRCESELKYISRKVNKLLKQASQK